MITFSQRQTRVLAFLFTLAFLPFSIATHDAVAQQGTPPTTVLVIGEDIVDSTLAAGPRFLRINFDGLSTSTHTVSVAWEGDADVRFNVFDETTGNRLNNGAVRDSNPAVWSGELVAGQPYSIRLWSAAGIATITASIEASVPLSIEQQPGELTVTEGDSATFNLVAAGSGSFTYQWFADGVALPGETSDTLTLLSASLADDGTEYTASVSNGFEVLNSNVATLTVEAAPSITITGQPVDLSIIEGEDASFSVAASGTGTLSYQWFADGAAITDATSSLLIISAVALDVSDTVYSVVITDDNEMLISESATLTVEPTPSPTTAVIIGEATIDADTLAGPRFLRINFDGLSTSTHNVSVAWEGDADVRFNVFDETTGNRLNIGAVRDSNPAVWSGELVAGQPYSIRLWSAAGIATITASIEASVPLSIEQQPGELTVTEGDSATFNLVAAGSGSFTYQWFADGVALPGETSDTLTLLSASLADDGTEYTASVSNGFEVLNSNVATLTVEAAPSITITGQPVDLSIIEGEDASFSVAASGTGTLSYQWFADGAAITDATSSLLIISAVALDVSGTVYSVVITDDTETLSSESATLSVEPTPPPTTAVEIGQATIDADRVAGPRSVRINFDALATASHTITVAWQGDADVRFNVFDASSGNRLNAATIRNNNPGTWVGELVGDQPYFISVWSTSGIAEITASIEVSVPISVQRQPANLLVTEGDNATFFVEASGSGTLTYQWFGNDIALEGESSDTLFVSDTLLSDDGTLYSVDISNGASILRSDAALLSVNETPVLGIYSSEADTTAWTLAGPAPTLDFNDTRPGDAWGRRLLRIDDLLLVGGDFTGIVERPFSVNVTQRPFLAAFDAVTGLPVSSFQVPPEVDSVVRALVLSPSGQQVYVGGDFGVLILDAVTGALESSIDVAHSGEEAGRVFDIAVTDTQLYIGGDFTNINGSFRANIARLTLDGELDGSWTPNVSDGFTSGRSAPVQAITVSPLGNVVYLGGNFAQINGISVDLTLAGREISMLSLSALDGSVLPERFAPFTTLDRGVQVHDIAVTDDYVIISWGGPNFLTFHLPDGTRLQQYRGTGDIQALEVVGDNVLVGHHGEFFGFLPDPIPLDAISTEDPEVIIPHRLHVFRLDTPDFAPGQAFRTTSPFGIWGIAVAADSIWVAGQIESAGTNEHSVDGLVRFPALDQGEP